MSVQTICASGQVATSGNFNLLVGRQTAGTLIETPIAVAGTLGQWRIRLITPPGTGKSRTWTAFKNGSSTALTVTISDLATTGSDLTNTVTIAANDTVKWVCTSSGTPATSEFQSAIDWTPTTADVSIFAFSDDLTGAAPDIGPIGGGNGGATAAFTTVQIMPAAGTVTALSVKTNTAPGTLGDNFTYAIVKNGTLQDGSGGSTDTRAQILNTAVAASSAFSLAVAAGDLLAIRYTPGGPSPAGSLQDVGTIAFLPTTAGQSLTGMNSVSQANTATSYHWPHGSTATTWSTTEADREFIGGTTDIVVAGIYAEVSVAPGVGKSRAFTVRKNNSDTAATITISGTATTGNLTGVGVVITSADRWALVQVPTATPATCAIRVSLLIDANADPTLAAPAFTAYLHP